MSILNFEENIRKPDGSNVFTDLCEKC